MEINFRARCIDSTNIRKITPLLKKNVARPVSFIEFNTSEKNDIKVLKKVAKDWKDSAFAKRIYELAKSKPDKKIFAITKQNSDFENINHKDILSLTLLTKEYPKKYCIDFLETKPEYQQENKSRKYKRIGSRTLHCLKKHYIDSSIKVNYLYSKIEFYMNNGFDFEDSIFGDLVWQAPDRK